MNEYEGFWAGGETLARGLAWPLLLGAVAAVIRAFKFGWKDWRHLVASSLVSVFVAVLTYWALDYLNLEPTVDAAIIGVSAYFGGAILDALMFRVTTEIRTGTIFRRHGEQHHDPTQGFYSAECHPGHRAEDREGGSRQ